MNIDKRISVAEGFIATRKYKKAIDYLTEIINENPNEYNAIIQRGYAYFCNQEFEKSITDLINATIIYKDADIAYWYLSQIFLAKSDYAKAEEFIIKAYEIDKENVNYIHDFAIIEQSLKNYYKSNEFLDLLINNYPADAFALSNRGYNYLCLKEYSKAIKDFERALIETPKDFFTLNNIGFALTNSGEYKKAFKFYELAIQLNPNFAYPYDNLGHLYYLEGDFLKALELINTSIEIDPSNSWAYKNRALVYIALGKNEEAKSDLNWANELGYTEEYDNEVDELLSKI